MDRRLIMRRLACLVLLALLPAWGGLAHAAPARQDPYPVPEQPTTDPLAPLPTPSAYPPPALIPAATPEPIGVPFDSQGTVGVVSAPTSVPAPPSSQGVLFLWLGFVSTLLIFGAAVLGAVMLFTRRMQS